MQFADVVQFGWMEDFMDADTAGGIGKGLGGVGPAAAALATGGVGAIPWAALEYLVGGTVGEGLGRGLSATGRSIGRLFQSKEGRQESSRKKAEEQMTKAVTRLKEAGRHDLAEKLFDLYLESGRKAV